jgi:hypothetical protein
MYVHIYKYTYIYTYTYIHVLGETNATEDSEEIEQIKNKLLSYHYHHHHYYYYHNVVIIIIHLLSYTSGETNATEDSEEIEQIKFNLAEKKKYDLMEIERKETIRINQEEDKWLAEARERLKERYSPGSVDGEGEGSFP